MKYLQKTSWDQVFSAWADRESTNPDWIHCATNIKGWPDWQSWRMFMASLFKAKERVWELYTLSNPQKEIPSFFIGPFKGWQNMYAPQSDEFSYITFAELFDNPASKETLAANSRVIDIWRSLPFSTELIALKIQNTQDIILIDGHHRCAAITKATKEGRDIDFTQTPITVALATIKQEEGSVFDEMLHRGTSYNR